MRNYNILKKLTFILTFLATALAAQSQTKACGTAGIPHSIWYEGECEQYRWPDVPSACPEVIIMQKGDHHWEAPGAHTTSARYRREGWDTVVDCQNREIILSCTPNIPARRFNGTYYVEEIPYDPEDPTFYLNYNPATDATNPRKRKLAISSDDAWAPGYVEFGDIFPFYFFGIRKTKFLLGDNGIVTFATPSGYSGGQGCPFASTTALPWSSSVPTSTSASGSLPSPDLMRDAIYGVYEDTYTGSGGDYMHGNQGIYYGVVGEEPCQKIIASWNQIPVFNDSTKRQSYQIVCYQGSNIIEIHIKKRNCCPSTNGQKGLIGIQNATGQNQVHNPDPNASNGWSVIDGKDAAFSPSGYNVFTNNIDNKAFRFTPWGQTACTYGWYRLREVTDTLWSSDSLSYTLGHHREYDTLRNVAIYPDAQYDSIGYFEPMHETDDAWPCKFLTKAHVHPQKPTKYFFFLKFKDANNYPYNLLDSIMVGVDTVNYLNIHKAVMNDKEQSKLDACIDDAAQMRIDMNKLQSITEERWTIFRIADGDTIILDTLVGDGNTLLHNDYLNVENYRMIEAFRLTANDTIVLDTMLFTKKDYAVVGDTIKTRQVTIQTSLLPNTGLRRNKIDTLIIQVSADYESGCVSSNSMMTRVYPKFDITIDAGICRGDQYTWDANERTYTESTNPATTFVKFQSGPGCDSIVRLNLTVMDVSKTIDPIVDCKPITWINGKTYTTSNTATAETDTVVLKNRWDCDSVVQLQFTLQPVKAKLQSDIDHFSIDNLNAVLNDISIGGNSRVWKFPTGSDQIGETAYYTIPTELDGAEIFLIESSEYGCIDTASIYLPLRKETFWVPNAFTPDNPTGNNLFGSVSTKTLYQEMKIYNRRGELVFDCEGVDCAWDGRDLNGNQCIQGAYVYIIRYTNVYEPQNTQVLTGTVTLIR